jgi:hypothetical protein
MKLHMEFSSLYEACMESQYMVRARSQFMGTIDKLCRKMIWYKSTVDVSLGVGCCGSVWR